MQKTQVDALGDRHRHQPWRYKFTQAHRQGAASTASRPSTPASQRAPGDGNGSSSVPEDWLAIINTYGGDMGQTYGVPVERIVEGNGHGAQGQHHRIDRAWPPPGRSATTVEDRKQWTRSSSSTRPRAMKAICQACYRPGRSGMASVPARRQPGCHSQQNEKASTRPGCPERQPCDGGSGDNSPSMIPITPNRVSRYGRLQDVRHPRWQRHTSMQVVL